MNAARELLLVNGRVFTARPGEKTLTGGVAIVLHAQGDRAIDRVLDANAAALQVHPGPITGTGSSTAVVRDREQVARMAALGVMVVGQPRYFWDAGDAWLQVLDHELAYRLQPYREFVRAGVRFALSSDAPVASYRPLDTVSSAVKRTTLSGAVIGGDQALTVEEAVRAATAGAAASFFAEDRLGTLEIGKLADVAVLDRDLFATSNETLSEVQVELTVVGGAIAYDTGRLASTTS